jgi:hypothetical protein
VHGKPSQQLIEKEKVTINCTSNGYGSKKIRKVNVGFSTLKEKNWWNLQNIYSKIITLNGAREYNVIT